MPGGPRGLQNRRRLVLRVEECSIRSLSAKICEGIAIWPKKLTTIESRLTSSDDLYLIVSCDMKLHSILPDWSNPAQALRVAAGILGKHASDGRWSGPLLSEV